MYSGKNRQQFKDYSTKNYEKATKWRIKKDAYFLAACTVQAVRACVNKSFSSPRQDIRLLQRPYFRINGLRHVDSDPGSLWCRRLNRNSAAQNQYPYHPALTGEVAVDQRRRYPGRLTANTIAADHRLFQTDFKGCIHSLFRGLSAMALSFRGLVTMDGKWLPTSDWLHGVARQIAVRGLSQPLAD